VGLLGVFLLLLQLLPNIEKSAAAVAADIRLFCSSNSCNTQMYKRKSWLEDYPSKNAKVELKGKLVSEDEDMHHVSQIKQRILQLRYFNPCDNWLNFRNIDPNDAIEHKLKHAIKQDLIKWIPQRMRFHRWATSNARLGWPRWICGSPWRHTWDLGLRSW
jgi:hypothetical protein